MDKYPESSNTKIIIGCAFNVYNELGFGLPERIYQEALAEEFKDKKVEYEREKYGFITYNGKRIGKYYIDFLIEGKIALEIKARDQIQNKDVAQLLGYMKAKNIKVGLLIAFSKTKVKIKRLVN